jgi:murein L,D-transpeptidase YcbB/YkuD
LRALGDLPSSVVAVSADVYADPLVSAVRSFQVRHGLEPDGVIGRATMAALAVPLARRVTEIEFSLERLRWLPDFTNARVIAVNIPTFQLFAWEATRVNGVPAFSTRAIVGKAMRTETPVFVEELNEVVFRPFWNIPRSILRGEILPALAKNSGYLAEHGMDIVDGPGDEAPVVAADEQSIARLRAGTLRLRQRPGPANALGLVKFVLPNDDNVYLHGTPAPALFGRARRDFSHGCVRVDDPASLAEWVLAGQGWTRERIAGAMQGTRTQRVRLARPIQIVLFYLTAAVAADGTMHFADDIYGHDQRLASVLARPRPTSRSPS